MHLQYNIVIFVCFECCIYFCKVTEVLGKTESLCIIYSANNPHFWKEVMRLKRHVVMDVVPISQRKAKYCLKLCHMKHVAWTVEYLSGPQCCNSIPMWYKNCYLVQLSLSVCLLMTRMVKYARRWWILNMQWCRPTVLNIMWHVGLVGCMCARVCIFLKLLNHRQSARKRKSCLSHLEL